MRDSFLRFSFAAQAERRLAFEMEQLLFRDGRRVRQIAAGENPREFPANERVVLADPASTPRELNPEFQSGKYTSPSDANGRPRLRSNVFRDTAKRDGFRIFFETIAVHRDAVRV